MRELFLLDRSIKFLNHGSFGACPTEVFEVYQDWQRRLERNPVEFLGRQSGPLLAQAQEVLGAFLKADPEDLAFVSNATQGVNTVARSLPFTHGDTIVTTDHEYGALDNAWRFVAEATGARVVRVPIPLPFQSDQFVDRIFAAVTPATRLISLSHITSPSALVFPVAEVCRRARERGIMTLVDGAHAPGQLELDLNALGADFYIGNCHKWMCAPKGAAFLHVRREHQPKVHATVVSWGYSENLDGHESITGTTTLSRRLQWQGTRDIAAFLSVPAAIHFLEHIDWRGRALRNHELAWQCATRAAALSGTEPICRSTDCAMMAVLPAQVPDAAALQKRLFDQYRIEVPVMRQGERRFVRVSVFGYTTQSDIDSLLDALADIGAGAGLPQRAA
jgi:isopenicillin-N epimerase